STSDGTGASIESVDATGSNRAVLTTGTAVDTYPSVSPDGRTIAFRRNVGGSTGIWAMNIDGSNQHQLTSTTTMSTNRWTYGREHVVFSPDGTHIAFSDVVNGHQRVFVMNADGSGRKQVGSPLPSSDALSPTYSPDGTQLAFAMTNS